MSRLLIVIPEAGIDIAVPVDDRGVRLVGAKFGPERIVENPEGLHRRRIERLNDTTGERDEDHAVSIARRVDRKAGPAYHLRRPKDFAARLIHLDQTVACVEIEIAVHEDWRARRRAIPSFSGLHCPVEHGIFRLFRRRRCSHCIVVFSPEVSPLGIHIVPDVRILLRLLQRDLIGSAVCRRKFPGLSDAACPGSGPAVRLFR